jgi:hypothetical protein
MKPTVAAPHPDSALQADFRLVNCNHVPSPKPEGSEWFVTPLQSSWRDGPDSPLPDVHDELAKFDSQDNQSGDVEQ